jgi:hypothetical protein
MQILMHPIFNHTRLYTFLLFKIINSMIILADVLLLRQEQHRLQLQEYLNNHKKRTMAIDFF